MGMNMALAILHHYPNASPCDDFRVRDDGTGQIVESWQVTDASGNPVPEPTEEELTQWWADYEVVRAETEYRDLRRPEYPPIGDQLDALWKAWDPPAGSEAAAMKERCMAVKAEYPKPGQQ